MDCVKTRSALGAWELGDVSAVGGGDGLGWSARDAKGCWVERARLRNNPIVRQWRALQKDLPRHELKKIDHLH